MSQNNQKSWLFPSNANSTKKSMAHVEPKKHLSRSWSTFVTKYPSLTYSIWSDKPQQKKAIRDWSSLKSLIFWMNKKKGSVKNWRKSKPREMKKFEWTPEKKWQKKKKSWKDWFFKRPEPTTLLTFCNFSGKKGTESQRKISPLLSKPE